MEKTAPPMWKRVCWISWDSQSKPVINCWRDAPKLDQLHDLVSYLEAIRENKQIMSSEIESIKKWSEAEKTHPLFLRLQILRVQLDNLELLHSSILKKIEELEGTP